MNDVTQNAETGASAPAMAPAKGLLLLLGVVVVVGGFIGLNAALGIKEFWGGFLFLLYWTGVEHMKFEKLPGCITGALVGLLLGYLLLALPLWMGEIGGVVFLALILVLVYFQIMSWLPVAVNMMTMLFLTVGTIPSIQTGADFAGILAALVLGIVYFVGLLWLANKFQQRKANAAAA
jgi:hypothetical protein